MLASRLRFLSLMVGPALGVALVTAVPAAAGAATAHRPPPLPSPSYEGPAGPPALMPDGRVAPPPPYASPEVAPGCPAAPYGPRYYAPGKGKTVALTFDDGPGASTGKIRGVLRKYGVTATFFNLGQNAAARSSQVVKEARAGYLIGNHTWDHADLTTLSASRQSTEMDRASAEQKLLVGGGPCAFRPPYGSYNSTTLSLAQQRRLKVWLWSVDTEDWKAGGSSSSYWVNRIIRLAEQEGGALSNPVVLMHNQPAGNPATVLALPTIIKYFRNHGYTFVDLFGRTGTGYQILTSDGAVHSFGAPGHGSAAGTLPPGVKPAGLAAGSFTGGYWILRSDGGVDNFQAPWYGSLRNKLPAGQTPVAIAGARGGYLILTSDGGIHGFGTKTYGSDAGKLPAGVTAAGLAADPAAGGYWILRSDGQVNAFNAPFDGSLGGKLPPGVTVTSIVAGPTGGYLILTSDGGVHGFGTKTYGSDAGTLPAGVNVTGLAVAPATGGYWILKSNGGVDNFNAPWRGNVKRGLPAGVAPTAIAGE